MEAIVAVDNAWAIGFEGQLLQPISADLKRFKQLTMGKILIYGRKTLASFPGQKPLPQRRNLILSRQPERLSGLAAECFGSVADLLQHLSAAELEISSVIGGDSVYRQLLPYCERVYVTKIAHSFSAADTYFPDLDALPDWQVSEQGEWQVDPASGLRFAYLCYERVPSDG